MDPDSVLACLSAREPILGRTVVVVAHPDDEVLGAGIAMSLCRDLTLVHVTDGAPADMRDAFAAGYETAEEYAAARSYELACALETLGIRARCEQVGVRDQEAVFNLHRIEAALGPILDQAEVVFTHAYEGGHPDHDACALAVRHVVGSAAHAALLEFPLYHAGQNGEWVLQEFFPGVAAATLWLDLQEQTRKRAAVECFATQRRLLARFSLAREVFRPAPQHDFTQPPHDGTLLYEQFGWQIDGEGWREAAAGSVQ